MPNNRRAYLPGGTYFFTVVTHRRRRLFHLAENQTILGGAIRECQRDWPFQLNTVVLLPDHWHSIWTLPSGDDNYSGRMSVIKKTFTEKYLAHGGQDWNVSTGKRKEKRRGVWQRRFWEHAIENEKDFVTHFDYIHYNPVKHKLVKCPKDWEATSFHRWVEQGVYLDDWGCKNHPPVKISETKDDYGEPL